MVRITGRWLLTFLLLGGSAAAQSAQTLITNDSVAYDGNTLELRQSGYDEIAQSFRAGPLASDGEMLPDGTRWVITEVRVRLNFEDTRQVPRARICTGYRGARPNNQEMDCPNGELSGPTRSSYGERVVTYTHRGYALNAGEQRWIVLKHTADGEDVLVRTMNSRSSTGLLGWDLPDRLKARQFAGERIRGTFHTFWEYVEIPGSRGFKIEVRGHKGTPPAALPPRPSAARLTSVKLSSIPNRQWVSGCSANPNQVYGAGEQLTYAVEYDKAVTVTGSPALKILVGDGTSNERQARYASSDTSGKVLTFAYTVQSNDSNDLTGPQVRRGSLVLNTAVPQTFK